MKIVLIKKFRIMKKVFVLLLGLIFLSGTAQKMSIKYLEGQWTSNGEGTDITIEKAGINKLTISEISSYSGDEVKVLNYKIEKNCLYIETIFEPTGFKAISKYIIINENTMVADIVSDQPGQVIYKRLINPKEQ